MKEYLKSYYSKEDKKELRKECKKRYRRKHKARLSTARARKVYTQKKRYVKYLGGECLHCGLVANPCNLPVFDFHHRDPSQKDFGIGDHVTSDWQKLRSELDKCDLLCANCHRLIHAKYVQEV